MNSGNNNESSIETTNISSQKSINFKKNDNPIVQLKGDEKRKSLNEIKEPIFDQINQQNYENNGDNKNQSNTNILEEIENGFLESDEYIQNEIQKINEDDKKKDGEDIMGTGGNENLNNNENQNLNTNQNKIPRTSVPDHKLRSISKIKDENRRSVNVNNYRRDIGLLEENLNNENAKKKDGKDIMGTGGNENLNNNENQNLNTNQNKIPRTSVPDHKLRSISKIKHENRRSVNVNNYRRCGIGLLEENLNNGNAEKKDGEDIMGTGGNEKQCDIEVNMEEEDNQNQNNNEVITEDDGNQNLNNEKKKNKEKNKDGNGDGKCSCCHCECCHHDCCLII